MIEIKGRFILSTGRTLYSEGNVFGSCDTPLTKVECTEIANHMIDLWTQWRDSK